jgi:hypothetical protein
MRTRLSLLFALTACKTDPTELTGVVPSEISARAGHEICLQGARLPKEGRVWFGDVDAGVAKRDVDARLCLDAPALLAGVYDVRLGEGADPPMLPAALSVRPLDLAFVEAAAHYLPDPGTPIAGGVGFDADADGVEDVVAWDVVGGLAVWRSEGTGAFVDLGAPVFDGAVGGLARVRTPEGPALFVCMADGVRSRLFTASEVGLVGGGAPPAEVGGCRGAAAADLDGDGSDEVVVMRGDGVRIWTTGAGGLSRFSPEPASDAEDCGAMSATEDAEPGCLVLDGAATFWAEGAGEARLRIPLPPLAQPDDGLALQVGGDLVAIEVVDAEGVVFSHMPGEVGDALADLRTPPVADWSTEAAPVLPLSHASLVLASTGETVSLTLTALTVALPAGGEAPAVRYRVHAADIEARGTAAVALPPGATSAAQILVLGEAGPALFEGDAAAWRGAAPGALPESGCEASSGVALDADADGEPELFLACAGQDRLLRGDGTGRWFDDTLGSLPVDAGDGRGVAAADLDRDGLPELLVATEAGVDRLYRGDGARFADWSVRLGLRDGSGRAVVPLDADADGDLDVLVLNGGAEAARLLIQTGD